MALTKSLGNRAAPRQVDWATAGCSRALMAFRVQGSRGNGPCSGESNGKENDIRAIVILNSFKGGLYR